MRTLHHKACKLAAAAFMLPECLSVLLLEHFSFYFLLGSSLGLHTLMPERHLRTNIDILHLLLGLRDFRSTFGVQWWSCSSVDGVLGLVYAFTFECDWSFSWHTAGEHWHLVPPIGWLRNTSDPHLLDQIYVPSMKKWPFCQKSFKLARKNNA